MKLRNKILTTIMVVAASMAFVTMSAFAASATLTPSETAQAGVKPGETFTVDLALADNPGLISLHFNLDAENCTITSVEDKGLLVPFVGVNNDLFWLDEGASKNYDANGTIATLTFTVDSDAKAGDKCTIAITTDGPNTFDYDFMDVNFGSASTTITVVEDAPAAAPQSFNAKVAYGAKAQKATGIKFNLTTDDATKNVKTVDYTVPFFKTEDDKSKIENIGNIAVGLTIDGVPSGVTVTANSAELY